MKISLLNIKYFLFFLYLVLFFIYGSDPNKLFYSEIVLIALSTFELFNFIRYKKFKISFPIFLFFLLSFFCLISSFWAIDSNLAISKAKTLSFLSLFYFIGFNLFSDDKDNAIKLIKIIMYAGVIFSLYIVNYYGLSKYCDMLFSGVRIGSEINNVNGIGLTTVISFLMSIFLVKYESKKYVFYSIFLTIITIGTGSRTALLELLFSVLLVMLFDKDKAKIASVLKKIIVLCLLFFTLIFVVNQFSSFDLVNRFIEMFNFIGNSGDVDGSTITRMKFIQEGFNTFLQHPIFGIGGGNSGFITSIVSPGRYTYLHNNYVELLSTLGLVGFCLYYMIHFIIIIGNIKKNKKDKYTILAIIIILLLLLGDIGNVSYYSKTTIVYFLYGTLLFEEGKYDKKNN